MDHTSSGHHPNKKRKVADTEFCSVCVYVCVCLLSNFNAAKAKIEYIGIISE